MSQELLQRYMDANKMHSFEGERGVQRMEKVMHEVGGYGPDWGGTMRNFFADNPGAMQAVVEWIGKQCERGAWADNLAELIGEGEEAPEED